MQIVLPNGEMSEKVKAEVVGEFFRIADVPALHPLLNIGDHVRVDYGPDGPLAVELVESAGWSNFALLYEEPQRDRAAQLLARLETAGCVVSSRKPVLVNLACPPHLRDLVTATLHPAEEEGIWQIGVVLDRGA